MSERPTISIYLNDHIVDFGYYRNWSGRSLLIESCELAKRLDGCGSYKEVQMRLGNFSEENGATECPKPPEGSEMDLRTEKQIKMLSTLDRAGGHYPEEELMLGLEVNSEFPIYIDLTRRCFYNGKRAYPLHPDPSAEDPSARFGPHPRFLADDIEVLSWSDWVEDHGGWYAYWAACGKAVGFDDIDLLLDWIDGDR